MKSMAAVATVAVATCLVLSACGGGDVSKSGGGSSSGAPGSSGAPSGPGNPTSPGGGGTTAKAGWSALAPVDGKGPEFLPSVTIDAQGNALALWMTNGPNNGPGNEMWASRYVPGTGWATPTRVDTTDGTPNMTGPGTSAPQLVGSADGHAVALWEQFVASVGYGLWARPYDPATGWGTAVQLAPDETSETYAAGIDAKGNAIVAWTQRTDVVDTRVFATRYTVGGSWSTPAQIQQPAQTGPGAVTGVSGQDIYNESVNIAVTSSGNAALTWLQTDTTNTALWTATFDPDNGWTDVNPVVTTPDPLTKHVFSPDVGMDAKGNLTLVWAELDIETTGNFAATMSQRYVAGTGWQTPQAVTTPFTEAASLTYPPVVTVNEQGIAAVMWIWPDGTLQASVADAAGKWGATQQISAHPYLLGSRLPQLVVDAAGNATLAWTDTGTSGSNDIFTSRYSNGAWGTATLFGQNPQDANYPALAVNASGVTALVWQLYKDNTVGNVLQASFYTPGT